MAKKTIVKAEAQDIHPCKLKGGASINKLVCANNQTPGCAGCEHDKLSRPAPASKAVVEKKVDKDGFIRPATNGTAKKKVTLANYDPKAPIPAKDPKTPKEKEATPVKPPKMVKQKGYKGEVEELDFNVYKVVVTCSCGEKRYIKPQDAFQVKTCKPCSQKRKMARISASKKAKNAKPAPAPKKDTRTAGGKVDRANTGKGAKVRSAKK